MLFFFHNQPTAQFYRVSTDNAFPYRLLGGQQDNSTVRIRHRSAEGSAISLRDWEPTAGGESGHVVAKPDDPDVVYGGSYGGYLTRVDHRTGERDPAVLAELGRLRLPVTPEIEGWLDGLS